jgi:hypothetical protein
MTEQVRGGPADVLYVLVLVQVGAGLLAMVGELVVTGGRPAYAVVPLLHAAALLLLAAKVRRGRRWAMVTLLVLQVVGVAGFWLGVLAGLLKEVDATVNLVGVLMGLALPIAVCWLDARVLAATPRRARRRPPVPATAGPVPAGVAR